MIVQRYRFIWNSRYWLQAKEGESPLLQWRRFGELVKDGGVHIGFNAAGISTARSKLGRQRIEALNREAVFAEAADRGKDRAKLPERDLR